jgi:hypothetical protein
MASNKKALANPWEQRKLLLTARRLPFSLNDFEAGVILGNFSADGVGILVSLNLLKPQEDPPKGAPKDFTTEYILECGNDRKLLEKFRKAVRLHNKQKNDKQKAGKAASPETDFQI